MMAASNYAEKTNITTSIIDSSVRILGKQLGRELIRDAINE